MFRKLSALTTIMAILHLSLVPAKPAFAAPTPHRFLVEQAELVNGLGTPENMLEFLRSAGLSSQAREFADYISSKGMDFHKRFPVLTVSGSRLFVTGSGEAVTLKSVSPFIVSYKGKTWSYGTGKSVKATLESLEGFFAQGAHASAWDLLLPSAFAMSKADKFEWLHGATIVSLGFLAFGGAVMSGAVFPDVSKKTGLALTLLGVLGLTGVAKVALADDAKLTPVSVEGCDPASGDPSSLKVNYRVGKDHSASAELKMKGDDPESVTTVVDGKSDTLRLSKDQKTGRWMPSDSALEKYNAVIAKSKGAKMKFEDLKEAMSGIVATVTAGVREACRNPKARAALIAKVKGNAAAVANGGSGGALEEKGSEATEPAK